MRQAFCAGMALLFTEGDGFAATVPYSPCNVETSFELFDQFKDGESYVALLATARCASAA
jgi:hypothetical protein